MIELAPAPLTRTYSCGSCGGAETRQRLVAQTNGSHPRADHYLCGACGKEVLSLANVPDALALCASVVQTGRRGLTDYGDVRSGEREELIAELRLALWNAWLRWDPARSPSFLAFATVKLRQAAINWDRERRGSADGEGGSRRGRHKRKPLADAVSLDAPAQSGGDDGDATRVDRVRAPLGTVALDDRPHSLADLRRTLARRSGEVAREDALVGREAAAGAPPRDRGARCRTS